MMETIDVNGDVQVFYLTAASFPDGIMDAFKKLHNLLPAPETRNYYGISRPEKGIIVYKAAVEELYRGEAQKLSCPTLIIKKGKYISSTIQDYMKDLPEIGRTFKELLAHPRLDPDGYCVEWYVDNKDVHCMVRVLEE
jgi:hypothetical protein